MKKELNETETKRSAKRNGMARRITALVLAGVLTFGGTATVSAATSQGYIRHEPDSIVQAL